MADGLAGSVRMSAARVVSSPVCGGCRRGRSAGLAATGRRHQVSPDPHLDGTQADQGWGGSVRPRRRGPRPGRRGRKASSWTQMAAARCRGEPADRMSTFFFGQADRLGPQEAHHLAAHGAGPAASPGTEKLTRASSSRRGGRRAIHETGGASRAGARTPENTVMPLGPWEQGATAIAPGSPSPRVGGKVCRRRPRRKAPVSCWGMGGNCRPSSLRGAVPPRRWKMAGMEAAMESRSGEPGDADPGSTSPGQDWNDRDD